MPIKGSCKGAEVIKARNWCQTCHSEFRFDRDKTLFLSHARLQNIEHINIEMAEGSITLSSAMADKHIVIEEEEDLEVELAEVINQCQTRHHRQLINEPLQDFKG